MTDPNTPPVDDGFWQVPLTPIEDRTNPEPTLTGATEGVDYTVLYTNPAFAPPAPPSVPPKRKAPWIAAGAAAVIIPGLALLIGIGVGSSDTTDAAQAKPHTTTQCRPGTRQAAETANGTYCEVIPTTTPAEATSSPMVRWVQAHPEVTDVLTDAQTASEKFVAKAENSDIVGAMVVCATYAPKMEAAQRASAATDPDAPAAYVSWLRHQVGAFDACVDADFTSMQTQLELGTDDVTELSDLMDDALASIGA